MCSLLNLVLLNIVVLINIHVAFMKSLLQYTGLKPDSQISCAKLIVRK